jgi:YaiO family outer membrane protein
MKVCLLLISLFFFYYQTSAMDPDLAYKEARELAVQGKYTAAELRLKNIILQYPEYWDVHIYLARIQAWQNKFEQSDHRLYEVEEPYRNTEWWVVYTQNKLWQNDPEGTLQRIARVPENMLTDPDLALIKGRALYLNGDYQQAITFLESNTEHLNERGHNLLLFLKRRMAGNYAGMDAHYAFYEFNDGFFIQGRGGFQLRKMQIELRLNHGRRFNTTGNMAEIEAYAFPLDRLYIMMGGGISDQTIYPGWYAAVEPYVTFPAGLELSAGGRFMHFEDNNATVVTANATLYFGDWLGSIRTSYLFSDINDGFSVNAVASYFFIDRYHKLQFNAGGGHYVPETVDLSLPTGINTWWGGAEYIFPVYNLHHLSFRGEVARESPAGHNTWRVSIISGYVYLF